MSILLRAFLLPGPLPHLLPTPSELLLILQSRSQGCVLCSLFLCHFIYLRYDYYILPCIILISVPFSASSSSTSNESGDDNDDDDDDDDDDDGNNDHH